LSRLRELHPDTAVILITAFGSIDLAIESMRRGAAHFLTKPVKLRELLIAVEKVLGDRELRSENRALRREVEGRYRFANMIGKSKAMRDALDELEDVAHGLRLADHVREAVAAFDLARAAP